MKLKRAQAEDGRKALAMAVARLEEELLHRNSALQLAAEQVWRERVGQGRRDASGWITTDESDLI